MSEKRTEFVTILSFPILLLLGIVLIPIVTDYTDHQLAEQAVRQTTRWFSGHLLSALAFGISNLAVGTITTHLNRLYQSSPSLIRLLTALGSSFYAAGLGADGIGPLAVQSSGQSPVLFFDGSGGWVTGIFIAGTIIFGIGLLTMTIGAIQLGMLKGSARYISFISVLTFMVTPMLLSGWALYGVAVATFGIFVPFALAILAQQFQQ
jgi:hypothetical protein